MYAFRTEPYFVG